MVPMMWKFPMKNNGISKGLLKKWGDGIGSSMMARPETPQDLGGRSEVERSLTRIGVHVPRCHQQLN